jgi:hypothetical protein
MAADGEANWWKVTASLFLSKMMQPLSSAANPAMRKRGII